MKEGVVLELVTLGETMVCFVPREDGKLRYQSDFQMKIAGAESNCAIGLQKLGHSACWISRVGADEFGEFVKRSVRAEGISISGVTEDGEHRTGVMFKQTLAGNETTVTYYREGSAASFLSPNDISDEQIKGAKILHLTGITPVLSDSCKKAVYRAIELAKGYHVPVSFDPNIRLKLWKGQDHTNLIRDLAGRADYLLMGREEAEYLYGTGEPERLQAMLCRQGTVRYLAVKNGSQGAEVCSATELISIPPYPCHCIDPIGAGDAFNAGFLSGILEGKSLEECGMIGAVCGAMATQTRGDIEGYLSKEELARLLSGQKAAYR